jgi:hypothetical protein
MITDDPEQFAAYLRGETDDPGVVSAVRGGIQYPPRDRQLVTLDKRGRASLRGLATHDRYLVTREPDGTIVLVPAVVVPIKETK